MEAGVGMDGLGLPFMLHKRGVLATQHTADNTAEPGSILCSVWSDGCWVVLCVVSSGPRRQDTCQEWWGGWLHLPSRVKPPWKSATAPEGMQHMWSTQGEALKH